MRIKITKEIINNILYLLYDIENSNGVSRAGCYGLSKEIFKIILERVLFCGDYKCLIDYDNLIYLSWEANDKYRHTEQTATMDNIELWQKVKAGKIFWDIKDVLPEPVIKTVDEYINFSIEYSKRKKNV